MHAGTKGWIVLTRDKSIRYRELERLALKAAQVRAFVFTGGNVTVKDTAAILVKALPRIWKTCTTQVGPFIYHIGTGANPIRMS
jgi:PIN like domain